MLSAVRNETAEGPATKASKRDKFVQLAESRTQNAIRAIRVIGKLGNKSAYEYDDSDVQKIARALTRELEALKARMSPSGAKEFVDFKL
jgi:predicted helicase